MTRESIDKTVKLTEATQLDKTINPSLLIIILISTFDLLNLLVLYMWIMIWMYINAVKQNRAKFKTEYAIEYIIAKEPPIMIHTELVILLTFTVTVSAGNKTEIKPQKIIPNNASALTI